MARSAYALHAEDDDFGQPGTLVREVFDAAQRDKLVEQPRFKSERRSSRGTGDIS